MKHLSKLRLLAAGVIASTIVVAANAGPAAGLLQAMAGASAFSWLANPRRGCLGAYTQIQDVLQPAVWLPYTVQRTTELSELITSGIVDTSPQFAALADEGGATANMPYWTDLSGEDEVLSDQNPLTTTGIASGQDISVNNNRGKAWKHNDLAEIFSGDDPAAVAGDLVGAYWARRLQAQVLSILKGVFSTAGMASHLLSVNITSAGAIGVENQLTGLTWIDAVQSLGDHKDQLTAAIMHSQVEASLLKQDLIEFIPQSEGKPSVRTFQGKRIIIDDGMPADVVAGAVRYTTYLFGAGAIAYGVSGKYAQDQPEGGIGTWGSEFFREALAGNSGLITRRRFILHPRGIKWLGASQAGPTPTNTEMQNSANWLRVWDAKKIPIVAVQHNIAA